MFFQLSSGTSTDIVNQCKRQRAEREDLLSKLSIYTSVNNETVLKHESGAYKILPRSITAWSQDVLWDYSYLVFAIVMDLFFYCALKKRCIYCI